MKQISIARQRKQFEEGNKRAALVILSDVARYGGDGAGLVQWARLVAPMAATRRSSGENNRDAPQHIRKGSESI